MPYVGHHRPSDAALNMSTLNASAGDDPKDPLAAIERTLLSMQHVVLRGIQKRKSSIALLPKNVLGTMMPTVNNNSHTQKQKYVPTGTSPHPTAPHITAFDINGKPMRARHLAQPRSVPPPQTKSSSSAAAALKAAHNNNSSVTPPVVVPKPRAKSAQVAGPWDRLYSTHIAKVRQREYVSSLAEERRKFAETKECTFQPNLTPNARSPNANGARSPMRRAPASAGNVVYSRGESIHSRLFRETIHNVKGATTQSGLNFSHSHSSGTTLAEDPSLKQVSSGWSSSLRAAPAPVLTRGGNSSQSISAEPTHRRKRSADPSGGNVIIHRGGSTWDRLFEEAKERAERKDTTVRKAVEESRPRAVRVDSQAVVQRLLKEGEIRERRLKDKKEQLQREQDEKLQREIEDAFRGGGGAARRARTPMARTTVVMGNINGHHNHDHAAASTTSGLKPKSVPQLPAQELSSHALEPFPEDLSLDRDPPLPHSRSRSHTSDNKKKSPTSATAAAAQTAAQLPRDDAAETRGRGLSLEAVRPPSMPMIPPLRMPLRDYPELGLYFNHGTMSSAAAVTEAEDGVLLDSDDDGMLDAMGANGSHALYLDATKKHNTQQQQNANNNNNNNN
eukprot:PhM_4_TR17558/c10_g1_i1/m.42696